MERRRRTRQADTSFPVAIGEGSHPFPFRTRKLSLPPPMVLHAQVCGRVGRCRGLVSTERLNRVPCGQAVACFTQRPFSLYANVFSGIGFGIAGIRFLAAHSRATRRDVMDLDPKALDGRGYSFSSNRRHAVKGKCGSSHKESISSPSPTFRRLPGRPARRARTSSRAENGYRCPPRSR